MASSRVDSRDASRSPRISGPTIRNTSTRSSWASRATCSTDGRNSARIINAAKAETKGFELELTALPIDNLTLSASIAYLDAEFKDFVTPQGADLSGNKLQDSPEWQTVESISYTLPLAAGGLNFYLQHSYT